MSMANDLASPMRNLIQVDQQALDALQRITTPRITTAEYDAKAESMQDHFHTVLVQRQIQYEQADWPGFITMVWPNTPKGQTPIVTMFNNEDVLTTVLAVRAGIDVSTAIELTYSDKMVALSLRDLGRIACPIDQLSLCGIFRVHGAGDILKYALFATKEAMSHEVQHSADELILMHQDEEVGLFWGRDFYLQEIVYDLWEACPDEALWLGPSLVARRG